MCRRISFSPLNPRRVGPPTTGTEIIGGFAFDQTERPPRSLRKNSISLGHAADAAACFILLRPSTTNPARPVAKSGRAPGSGTALTWPDGVAKNVEEQAVPVEIWQICAEASLPKVFANSAKPVPLMVKVMVAAVGLPGDPDD